MKKDLEQKELREEDEADQRRQHTLEAESEKPTGDSGRVTTNQVDMEASRQAVDERLQRRNEANAAGHAKNMERIEKAHENNEVGKPAPFLGKEDNGNTPVIDEHGNKSWHPPGIA